MRQMKRILVLAFLVLAVQLTPAQGATEEGDALIRNALAYKESPSDSLRTVFNARYLRVRPGSSLVDKPHILYPDSTYYGSNRLDDNILPLAFGLVPDSLRDVVVSNVVTTIRRQHFRPRVRKEVEPYLLPVLAENGWNSWAFFICDQHPEMVTDTCIAPEYVEAWREKYLAGIRTLSGGKAQIRLKPDFRIQELDSLDCEA